MNFTLSEYESFLQLLNKLEYSCKKFNKEDLHPDPELRRIWIRHDIDYDPQWILPMAEIEARNQITSTYFIQMDSSYYSARSDECQSILRQVVSMDHHVGLHFDATEILDDSQVLSQVEINSKTLEELLEIQVNAVSFHMPTLREVRHLELHSQRINLYGQMLQQSWLEYASDSNMNWRNKNIVQMVNTGYFRSLHLLIHPFWWRYKPISMREKMQQLADKLGLNLMDVLTDLQWSMIKNENEC